MKNGPWPLAIGLWLLTVIPAVFAQGFGVSPSEITDSGTFYIINTDQERTFNIKTSPEIYVDKRTITLKPYEKQKIKATVEKNGQIEIYSDNNELNPGIIIPAKTTKKEKNGNKITIILLLIAALIIINYFGRIKNAIALLVHSRLQTK